jgi:acetoin utilization deacetylase AcuC-like enzyme
MNTVGLVYEEQSFWHQSQVDFGPFVEQGFQLETPQQGRRLLNLLHRTGLTDKTLRLRASEVTREDLLRVHSPKYVDFIASANTKGGEAGDFCPFGPGGYDFARLAAGGAFVGLEAVLAGTCNTAFVMARPPGHHAERDRGRGYCMFSNIGVALEKARAAGLVKRVAVVDWDVHHGNGTQWIYYDDPNTLTISLHQDGLYPHDSGMVEETGGPDAPGSNINIPLPAGTGIGGYEHAWDQVVAPAIRSFAPDVLWIASGFDASAFDPNARMCLSSSAFRKLTTRAMDLASEVCGGRLVICQEGGYSPFYVPICGAAVVETLLGEQPTIQDLSAWVDGWPAQKLQPHQDAAVARAREAWLAARESAGRSA